MLIRPFILMLKKTVLFILLMAACVSCSGGGDTAANDSITIQHQIADFPSGLEHIHYSGHDAQANRIYASPEFPVSSLHTLTSVPGNVISIAVEYHTGTEEELNETAHAASPLSGYNVLAPQYHGPQFDPNRLAIVDESGGNLLVRGNLPLVSSDGRALCYPGQAHCFAYAELDSRMREKIPGFDIEQFEVIDFTLIDNQGTYDELTAEINALGINGTDDMTCGNNWPPYNNGCVWNPKKVYTSITGEKKPWGMVWWPVYACGSRPCNDADADIGLNKFQFITASAYLRELLTTPSASGKKRLIYFHCVQGTDRTGALHITYIMDNNPLLNFQEAIAKAAIGAKQGSNDQQLNPKLVPMCTYVGLAYRYCLQQNPGNPGRCAMPGGFGGDATLCR